MTPALSSAAPPQASVTYDVVNRVLIASEEQMRLPDSRFSLPSSLSVSGHRFLLLTPTGKLRISLTVMTNVIDA